MNHIESGASAGSTMATSGNGSVSVTGIHHKKLRRKRKELDALVTEDKVRRKSSSASHRDLLHSDSDEPETDFANRGNKTGNIFGHGGFLGFLPGACTLLVLLTTVAGVAATLRLLMVTRRDLDVLHLRLNAVEASGSELPAKFHESHVRLQQLEKNHTALWSTLNSISTDVQNVIKKVEQMEANIKNLQDSISGAPHLSSLPKDVANLQDSIASFGSSLQDVQSSMKNIKENQQNMQKQIGDNNKNISYVKEQLIAAKKDTQVPIRGREGLTKEESVASAIVRLKDYMEKLASDVTAVNASVLTQLKEDNMQGDKDRDTQLLLNTTLFNISQRIEHLENTSKDFHNYSAPFSSLNNVSSDVTLLKRDIRSIQQDITNITQSIDVVKGVERKLEGSQVQMASGMSEMKQQLQTIDKRVTSLIPSTTPPPLLHPTNALSRKSRSTSQEERPIP